MKIDIDRFGGIAPIMDPRKLPERAATFAHDCKFYGTDLQPLLASSLVLSLAFNAGYIFKYQFRGNSYWLAWPSQNAVDVCRSPIPQDSLGRIYWTSVNLATINNSTVDNYPRCASQPVQSDIVNNTAVVRRLGVPQPATVPTVTENATNESVTSAVSGGITAMSATAPITVSTGTKPPFQQGWTVIAQQDGATSDGGMAEILGKQFVVNNVTANSFDLLNTDGSKYTKFVAGATNIKFVRAYLESDLEAQSWVVTYVTDWGEEGMPSLPAAVTQCKYDSTKNIAFAQDVPAWALASVSRMRLYRSAAGQSGASFFFAKEVPLAGYTGTILDDVPDTKLGEALKSATWLPPPNGMQGLRAMPNGFFVGFVGNTLYFSEPYQPHAWPAAYTRTTADNIVGIEVYGQTLVIATQGKPYLAAGSDPSSMTLQQLDLDAPCLNKTGMAPAGLGVIYPTPDGLALVGAMGSQIITLPYFNLQQWRAAWSNAMWGVFHEQRYIAFSPSASYKTLVVENRPDIGLNISDSSIIGTAPAIDPIDDSLNYIPVSGTNQNTIYKWEGGATYATANWQSKVFTLPHAINLSVARVFAQVYPVTLTVNYANFTTIFGQTAGEAPSSLPAITVLGSEPFRLPGGYLSREFQVQVQCGGSVQSVVLADNFDELR